MSENFHDLRNLADSGDLEFAEITPATGVGESSILCWELMRDVSEDNYGADARLFELDFHFQTNKSGTKNEIPEA